MSSKKERKNLLYITVSRLQKENRQLQSRVPDLQLQIMTHHRKEEEATKNDTEEGRELKSVVNRYHRLKIKDSFQ